MCQVKGKHAAMASYSLMHIFYSYSSGYTRQNNSLHHCDYLVLTYLCILLNRTTVVPILGIYSYILPIASSSSSTSGGTLYRNLGKELKQLVRRICYAP